MGTPRMKPFFKSFWKELLGSVSRLNYSFTVQYFREVGRCTENSDSQEQSDLQRQHLLDGGGLEQTGPADLELPPNEHRGLRQSVARRATALATAGVPLLCI